MVDILLLGRRTHRLLLLCSVLVVLRLRAEARLLVSVHLEGCLGEFEDLLPPVLVWRRPHFLRRTSLLLEVDPGAFRGHRGRLLGIAAFKQLPDDFV